MDESCASPSGNITHRLTAVAVVVHRANTPPIDRLAIRRNIGLATAPVLTGLPHAGISQMADAAKPTGQAVAPERPWRVGAGGIVLTGPDRGALINILGAVLPFITWKEREGREKKDNNDDQADENLDEEE